MKSMNYIIILFFIVIYLVSDSIVCRQVKSKVSNEMLAEITKDDSPKRKRDKTKYNNILKWIVSNGGKLNKFKLKFETDSNRYLEATADIKKGEIISEIPRKLLIYKGQKEIRDIAAKIKRIREVSDRPSIPFVLWIMKYRGKNSKNTFFKHYFDFLPEDLSNMPLLYSKKNIRHLFQSPFQKQKYKELDQLYIKDFNILKNAGVFEKGATYRDFVEAYKLFESRNFGLPMPEKNSVLIPLVDLFNFDYKNNRAGWFFDQNKDAFVITAHNDIKKGQEIYLDYGADSNSHYLKGYGFTIENPPKREDLTLNFAKNEETVLSGTIDIHKALKPIRKYVLIKDNQKIGKDPSRIISKENELKAISILVQNINEVLKSYGSDINNDLQQLQSKDTSFDTKNILRILIEERQILLEFRQILVDAKRVLTELKFPKDVKAKMNSKFPQYENYLTAINQSLGFAVKS